MTDAFDENCSLAFSSPCLNLKKNVMLSAYWLREVNLCIIFLVIVLYFIYWHLFSFFPKPGKNPIKYTFLFSHFRTLQILMTYDVQFPGFPVFLFEKHMSLLGIRCVYGPYRKIYFLWESVCNAIHNFGSDFRQFTLWYLG